KNFVFIFAICYHNESCTKLQDKKNYVKLEGGRERGGIGQLMDYLQRGNIDIEVRNNGFGFSGILAVDTQTFYLHRNDSARKT
ncbi:hypothetical protein GWI33_001498, partial [Rhynchophorus ferrugineus]